MARVAAWVGSVDDPPFASSLHEATAVTVASWHQAIPAQPYAEMRARAGGFLHVIAAAEYQLIGASVWDLSLRARYEHVAWLQAHAPPVN